jgi:hypothetical protein
MLVNNVFRSLYRNLQVTSIAGILPSLMFTCGAASAQDQPLDGVRMIGNTANQALICLPGNPKHAEFVARGNSMGNVKVYMLQTNTAVLESDGKRVDFQTDPKTFSALWLNSFLRNVSYRIDRRHPYLTETVTFTVSQNGRASNFNEDATIAKAAPFQRLPKNLSAITVRATTNPHQRTLVEALSVELQ